MRGVSVQMVVASGQRTLMFSVMLFVLDTIGLIPIGFLWIFLRKYNLLVLCSVGGLQ